jgi:hypothetical protein
MLSDDVVIMSYFCVAAVPSYTSSVFCFVVITQIILFQPRYMVQHILPRFNVTFANMAVF